MDFPRAAAVVPELQVAASAPSTNSELLAQATDPAVPSFAALLTLDQTAGRGRLDRTWVAPAGTALALSVLVRGALAHPLAGWLPLLAGLCLTEALDEVAPGRVSIKWPNDLLIEGRKVCGILVEVAPSGDAVVGSGLNLAQTREQLPVAAATSLALEGVQLAGDQLDALVAGYLSRLRSEWETPGPASRLRDRVVARCATIGHAVDVVLADDSVLAGVATGIDAEGRLEVRSTTGQQVPVAVGDVTHARLR
jgi:BirA family biotin operon repressor/biotin-[acetyl-CoA-carboxylase] ligase